MSVRVICNTGYKLTTKGPALPPTAITEEQVVRIIRTGEHLNDLPISVREAAQVACDRTESHNIPQARKEAREIMRLIKALITPSEPLTEPAQDENCPRAS